MSVKSALSPEKALTDILATIDFSKPGFKSTKIGDAYLTVQEKVREGDLCAIYEGSYILPTPIEEGTTKEPETRFSRILSDFIDEVQEGVQVVVKVVQDNLDNELIENEIRTLNTLFPLSANNEEFYRYLPRSYGGFKTSSGVQCHILEKLTGFSTLLDLRANSNGLGFWDVGRVFKKSLVALGFVHEQGFLHGAVLPPHILVNSTDGGLKIIDWSYAVRGPRGKVRAVAADYLDYYAPEILSHSDSSSVTDLYMLAKCIVTLLGGDPKNNMMPDSVPRSLQDFVHRFLDLNPAMRASDAWAQQEELNQVLTDISQSDSPALERAL